MESTEITTLAVENLSQLIELLAKFEQKDINIIPFEGRWTVGKVAQHMVMANRGFVDVMNGPVKETERAADEMEPKIKGDFLNFDIKMTTPAFIRPEAKYYDKEELISALKNIRESVNNAATTLDMTKTCTAFELPLYGYLTRLEAVSFIAYHTQRHIHQLKNIYNNIIE
ncbi:DinB family protein [Mucilaginibacter sp. BJC16-A38]|uniref:DinB family protein n=1 Tax=Mucilaginibacter phenanthrenivorans TaxID=1234842 RepID=UPI00215867F5|nr:DinB family protein [Mucilaginibacter phenanthrenivorans]MCR8556635.1 DinB family protein [Mucilaginibacter phenanthrenivorans]